LEFLKCVVSFLSGSTLLSILCTLEYIVFCIDVLHRIPNMYMRTWWTNFLYTCTLILYCKCKGNGKWNTCLVFVPQITKWSACNDHRVVLPFLIYLRCHIIFLVYMVMAEDWTKKTKNRTQNDRKTERNMGSVFG
jgi:hypothetical protein